MIKWILKKRAINRLSEPQPLPLGRMQFEVWSNRIINAAEIPGATAESLKFALAEMVLHVKPTESFVSDGYFIHCLRKGAANQVAHTLFQEMKKEQQARAQAESNVKALENGNASIAAKEENLKRLKGEVTPVA